MADEVVRHERWERLRDEYKKNPPPTEDPKSPWTAVIANSAFGVGTIDHWWKLHVEHPAHCETEVRGSGRQVVDVTEGVVSAQSGKGTGQWKYKPPGNPKAPWRPAPGKPMLALVGDPQAARFIHRSQTRSTNRPNVLGLEGWQLHREAEGLPNWSGTS